ncbi:MAG: fibrobacter succinogenes major paralogous domain-containing protein [Bacteroidota bacterium]
MTFFKNFTLILFVALIASCKKKSKPLYVTTLPVSFIQGSNAMSGGIITGEDVIAKGLCWGEDANPHNASGKTNEGAGSDRFDSMLTGLAPNVKYYVWAYAANEAGTVYADPETFTSAASEVKQITDYDGNIYHTTNIGSREWTQENLRVTHYNNGDQITKLTNSTDWTQAFSGAYCYYDNNITNMTTYGALYNWYSVNDSRKLAPAGWHIATQADWEDMLITLGGINVAGPKMRITTPQYWPTNSSCNNQSGFSAIPAGARNSGNYISLLSSAVFWSSTSSSSSVAMAYNLSPDYLYNAAAQWNDGKSVRCVKDSI